MKLAGACLIALFLISPALSADDREIARTDFFKARDLDRAGRTVEAETLLRRSIDLHDGNSETRFLLGTILCRAQETTAEGLAFIDQALKLSDWTDSSPLEARAALAAVYVRTRRFREALAIYNDLSARGASSGENEMNRALAAFGLGNAARADGLFASALRAFPEDARLYLAYIRNLMQRGLADRARVWTERGLRQFPDDPGFLFFQIALARNAASRKADFDLYRLKGGRDPAAALSLLDADNAAFSSALDFFLNHEGGENVLLIESLMNGLRRNRLRRDEAARRLGALEGEKTADVNGDGFYEEQYMFKDGALVSAIIDRNQDGAPEAEIAFAENVPVTVTALRPNGASLRFEYNGYPRLAKAVSAGAAGTVEYDLIPDALRFAPLASLPSPAEYRLRVSWPVSPALPDERRLNSASYARAEYPSDKTRPARKWDLYAGRETALREDTFRTGRYDRLVVYDERGLPLRGLVDLDGDGFSEIQETYVRGVLVRISYDENKDGRPDYWQDAAGNTLEWDLNGDGRPDVVGRRGAGGRIIADYSGLLRRNQ